MKEENVEAMLRKIKNWFRRYPIMIAVLYLVFYLSVFEWLEANVVPKYIIHCSLDDLIPFREEFIIPYMLWFVYIPFVFLWFLHRGWEDYSRLCLMVFSGCTICLGIYYVFPTGLNLRAADSVQGTGILHDLVGCLRTIDTPTNVCPSIHVMNTVMMFQAVCGLENLKHRKLTIAVHFVIMVSICASTVFLDQHSLVDVVCGVMMSVVLYGLVYQVEWKKILRAGESKAKADISRAS